MLFTVGENLAKNVGNFAEWGKLYPPENIVRRWVDFEIGWLYPANAHLTQAVSSFQLCFKIFTPYAKMGLIHFL